MYLLTIYKLYPSENVICYGSSKVASALGNERLTCSPVYSSHPADSGLQGSESLDLLLQPLPKTKTKTVLL